MKSIPNLVSKHNLKYLMIITYNELFFKLYHVFDENEISSNIFLKYDMIRESCNRLRLENKF